MKSKTALHALVLGTLLTLSGNLSGREYHAPLKAKWDAPERYGKWAVYEFEHDPFAPAGRGAVGMVVSVTGGNMRMYVQCAVDASRLEVIFMPYSDFASFAASELANEGATATVQAVFSGGKPRRLDLAIPAGSKYWWLNEGEDWFETGLREADTAFLRWRGREGTWDAEFPLQGSNKAIAAIKRRCGLEQP